MINRETALRVFYEMMDDLIDNYNFDEFLVKSRRESGVFCDWVGNNFGPHMISNGSWAGATVIDEKYLISNGCCRFILGNNNYPFIFKADFGENDRYCSTEEANYEMALTMGVEDRFAEIHYLTDFEGFSFYVMERAECDYEDICDEMRDFLVDTALEDGEYDGDEELAREEIYWTGDSDRVDEFFETIMDCQEYHHWSVFCSDNRITDIHAGNIGKIDDRWVVIDYAGYFG
jgi:hypothetical protein